jgi:ATP-dependent DNA ligase
VGNLGVLPAVVPHLVANDGPRALRQAIADPDRFACEPKVDGVRGLVVYGPEHTLEMRNRRGEHRDWLRGDAFEHGLRRLAQRLPNVWEGTVLDGELTSGRFEGTMAALLGSKRYRASLRFVVFDVPVLLGTDLRGLPWHERRERLELLAQAFDIPLELSPLVEPSVSLVEQMTDGRLEGIVLKDRTSTYRDGSRAGWTNVKDRGWYEREAWRFDRR